MWLFFFSYILSFRLLQNRLSSVLDGKELHESVVNEFEKTYTGHIYKYCKFIQSGQGYVKEIFLPNIPGMNTNGPYFTDNENKYFSEETTEFNRLLGLAAPVKKPYAFLPAHLEKLCNTYHAVVVGKLLNVRFKFPCHH